MPAATFTRLGRADGLSHFTVQDVLQDRQGFIWLATRGGLDRFDGLGFRHHRHDPERADSLATDRVACLLQTPDDALWVGTDGDGVDRLDPVSGRFTHFRPGGPGAGRANRISDLAADAAGNLWAATFDGVFRRAATGGPFQRVDAPGGTPLDGYVSAVLPRGDGAWAGTPRGLHWVGGSQPAPPAADIVAVQAIAAADAGQLWVATEGGLLLVSAPAPGSAPPTVLRRLLVGRDVQDVQLTRRGVLWAATDEGLVRLDPTTGATLDLRHDPLDAASLSHDNVTAVLEDSGGMVWAATWGAGVSRLDPRSLRVERARRAPGVAGGLDDDEVMSLLEDSEGTLWAGTWNGGLGRLRPGSDVSGFEVFRATGKPGSLGSDRVPALLEDREGRLWVGTRGGGINLFDRLTGRFEVIPQDANPQARQHMIHALAEDPSGILWLGTSAGGLVRFDPRTRSFRTFRHDPADPTSISDDDTWAMVADGGALWVATSNGLNRLDLQSGRFTVSRHVDADRQSLPHDHVYCLAPAGGPPGAMALWVGTEGGLALRQPDGRYTTFTEDDGLPSNHVRSLVTDRAGRLWVSTDDGLAVRDAGGKTFRTYRAEVGLQERGYFQNAATMDRQGRLLFGGLDGITRLDPADLQPTPPPRVALTELLLGGLPVAVSTAQAPTPLAVPIERATEIHLRHDHAPVGFEFAAPQYSEAGRLRFLYRLDGVDPGWVPAGPSNRRATYQQLAPGRYTFHVTAVNADGAWSPDEASIALVVQPPWWSTWTARLLAVLAALGLVVGVHRARLHHLGEVNRRLEQTVAARTSDLQEANRRLQEVMLTDPLTQLLNRRGFLDHAERELAATHRAGRPLVLGLGDLDWFKRINDSHGHEAGDRALAAVARTLREHLRQSDLVARWGGEEFVLLLPSTDLDGARVVAEKVRAAVAALRIDAGGTPIGTTLTLGLAAAELHESFDSLLVRADRALYAGKAAGRDRVVCAEAGRHPTLQPPIVEPS